MVAEELMRRGLHINCLPEEILIKIFSNLAARDIIRSVLPVCRLWYKLGYDPVLWKSLEFSYRSEHSCPNMIRTVTQRYGRWRSTFRQRLGSPGIIPDMWFILLTKNDWKASIFTGQ